MLGAGATIALLLDNLNTPFRRNEFHEVGG
jgi:hypothetical protein